MENTIINIALIVAITAFLREQFDLEGKQIKWAALGVFLFVWGAPQLTALLPTVKPILDDFLMAINVFLGAMGSADFVSIVVRKAKA